MFAPPVDPFVRSTIFPFTSSPLSPRSPNAQPLFMSHPRASSGSSKASNPSPITPPSQGPFAFQGQGQEATPFNSRVRSDPRSSRAASSRVGTPPLNSAYAARASEVRRHQRRDQFLGGVRQRQDDRRWEARGDLILHQDFVRRQREWESAKARSAPDIWIDSEDAETADEQWTSEDLYSSVPSNNTSRMMGSFPDSEQQNREGSQGPQYGMPSAQQPSDAEIDALLAAEEEELEAMVRLHEQQRAAHSSSPIYAEDEEFEDALWQVTVPEAAPGEDAMDMS